MRHVTNHVMFTREHCDYTIQCYWVSFMWETYNINNNENVTCCKYIKLGFTKERGEPQKGAVGEPTAQPKTHSQFGTGSKNSRSMKIFIDLAILNVLGGFK